MNKEKAELNNLQLESVVGGEMDSTGWTTYMKCHECGWSINWAGRYLDQTFDCPICGKHSFTGKSERYYE